MAECESDRKQTKLAQTLSKNQRRKSQKIPGFSGSEIIFKSKKREKSTDKSSISSHPKFPSHLSQLSKACEDEEFKGSCQMNGPLDGSTEISPRNWKKGELESDAKIKTKVKMKLPIDLLTEKQTDKSVCGVQFGCSSKQETSMQTSSSQDSINVDQNEQKIQSATPLSPLYSPDFNQKHSWKGSVLRLKSQTHSDQNDQKLNRSLSHLPRSLSPVHTTTSPHSRPAPTQFSPPSRSQTSTSISLRQILNQQPSQSLTQTPSSALSSTTSLTASFPSILSPPSSPNRFVKKPKSTRSSMPFKAITRLDKESLSYFTGATLSKLVCFSLCV
jgi:hypothetical protein